MREMIRLGIHGTEKSEVAAWIIRQWVLSNQTNLREKGILLKEGDDNG
jgi:hypothetical protein